VIALVVLLVGVSVTAVRFAGHQKSRLVSGPLAAGGAGSIQAVDGDSVSPLRRTGGGTVRMVRVRGPTARTTFAHASHPQRPSVHETEVRKFPDVLPKAIVPTVAYRLKSEGTPSINGRMTGLNSTQGQADPPDVAVAAGPTAIVEMVNTVYAMWSRSGTLLESGSLNSFFTSSGVNRQNDEVTDPRVLYDRRSDRWFSALFDVTRGEALVGVSDTSDPTAGWRLVAYAFIDPKEGTCPDQPRLGLSDNVVVVGVDLFENCKGGRLRGGVAIVYDKPAMLLGGSVPVNDYRGGTATSQITPATSLGPTGPNYMVSIRRDQPRIAFLYTVTSPQADEIPVQQVRITRMDPPPNAPQKGSPIRLDSGDDRVQNARWENGALTFVASDACRTGTVPLACARIAQINTANARLNWEKELVLGGGRYLLYPAIESDGAGNLLLTFGYSSGTEFPGVGAITLQQNRTFSSWRVVQKGTAPHTTGREVPRYGDYFGIAQDPAVPRQVWAGGEYGNGLQRGLGWGTTVFAMSSGSTNPPPPPPPDRKRPVVKPRPATVRTHASTKLRFSLRDNGGWALVTASVFRGSKRIKNFGSQELPNGTWSIKWRAPSRPARLDFCAVAVDPADNKSKVACAPVRVR